MNEYDRDDGLLDSLDRSKGFKEDTEDDWYSIRKPKKKCECGAHAVKSDKHSDWCPLYDED